MSLIYKIFKLKTKSWIKNWIYNQEQKEQPLIPTVYQQVDYIESSGTQYIDTGYKSNSNTKYDIKAMNPTVGFITGCQASNNRSNIYFSVNNKFSAGYGTQIYNSTQVPASNIVYNLVLDKNLFYINNVLEKTFTPETFDNTVNAFIFARNADYGIDGHINAKLYSCKIYDNDTLVRDFIPCYRKSDNVVGLYDLVNNVFYTNAGTGVFSYGGEV